MSTGCQHEAEELQRLGKRMIEAVPDAAALLQDWFGGLERLLDLPELETLATENTLDEMALELRRIWLRLAHGASDCYMKSPPLAQPKRMPNGEALEYSYERNLQPSPLEDRCGDYAPAPPGWTIDHVIFSSGQAALAALLQSWHSMVRPEPDDPLRLALFGSYFETQVLLGLLQNSSFHWQKLSGNHELQDTVARSGADIVLLESICYDWDLEPLDLAQFLAAWRRRRTDRPSIVIVDSTLSGAFFPFASVLKEFQESQPPALVVRLSSGLKLDQAGLELANVGILSLYVPVAVPSMPAAPQIGHYLRKMRTILGSGLSFDELAALSVPWFLDYEYFERYCQAVFENNAMVSASIHGIEGIFSRVVYPSLGGTLREESWAEAPFCVLHLREDTLADHGLLLGVLASEVRRRDLCFQAGSSFGFRGHRYETIVPRVADRKGLFKVAMGARGGPSRAGIVELLQEVASCPDMSELRLRYPEAQSVSLALEG